jgi:hypothetical protein
MPTLVHGFERRSPNVVSDVCRTLLSGSIAVRVVTFVLFVMYQPSLWDGSELKLGRPWDALRRGLAR